MSVVVVVVFVGRFLWCVGFCGFGGYVVVGFGE